jgi:hypothetical protein
VDDRIKRWSSLYYHDPARVLRKLRTLERGLADEEVDPKVRRLRTNTLKKYREWRDAALFLYGMGLSKGLQIGYATEERDDYDVVAGWIEGTTRHFCPVQLKELVPEDLNPNVSLSGLLSGLQKYGARTETVLVVKLNRRSGLDLPEIPRVPFSQLWFFWASEVGSDRLCLYGDALGSPAHFAFDYPD